MVPVKLSLVGPGGELLDEKATAASSADLIPRFVDPAGDLHAQFGSRGERRRREEEAALGARLPDHGSSAFC
jgi:hypothetical protein